MDTLIVIVLHGEYLGGLLIARTGLRIIALLVVDITRSNEHRCFVGTVLGTALDTFGIIFQSVGGILFRKEDVAQSAINLVQAVFVLILLSHLGEEFDRRSRIVGKLSQLQSGIEIHLAIGLHFEHFLVGIASRRMVVLQLVELA